MRKKKLKFRKFKLLAISLALVAMGISLLLFTPKEGHIQKEESQVIKCPQDYCEPEVWGSGPCPFWTNETGRYHEQKCYDYPNEATSLKECEEGKVTYCKICGVRTK